MSFFRRTTRPQRQSLLRIAGLEVTVTRKKMKYLRLRVTPPDGTVSISAPHAATNREIEAMIGERLQWIREQQAHIEARPSIPSLQYCTGEQHYLWGEKKTLVVVDASQRRVQLSAEDTLTLYAPRSDTREQRAQILDNFYRQQLHNSLPAMLEHWQQIVQRNITFWGIKKMKTRWGSCNIQRARIWLNLELAKYPRECLEYVVVHELTHLYEAGHNARFYSLLDNFLSGWKHWDRYLNQRKL